MSVRVAPSAAPSAALCWARWMRRGSTTSIVTSTEWNVHSVALTLKTCKHRAVRTPLNFTAVFFNLPLGFFVSLKLPHIKNMLTSQLFACLNTMTRGSGLITAPVPPAFALSPQVLAI